MDDVPDPRSFLLPSTWHELPDHLYALGSISYRIDLEPSQLHLGLSFFNLFGGRYREKAGISLPEGTNYGGELLDSRLMLTAHLSY